MGGERILVVDDNPANVKLVSFVLSASGFAVSVASNADEATRQIERENPNLVLMDIQLPGTDGLTLTKQLRAKPSTKNLIIVAFTAYAMRGDEQRALDAGCDGYLTKPIDTKTFAASVQKYLSTGAVRASSSGKSESKE